MTRGIPSSARHGSTGWATAPDGTPIYYATHGSAHNPSVYLGPHCFASPNQHFQAAGIPDPTGTWVEALAGDFHIICADYPRGMGRTVNPLGLRFTPQMAVEDLTSILDAVGVEQVAWVGYSYGGALGVQFACRSDRVSALVIGGWPPLNEPFVRLVEITTQKASRNGSDTNSAVDPQLLWSSVGFYTALLGWPERAQVSRLDMPRMTFMGADDDSVGTALGDLLLATCLRQVETDLAGLGWEIIWLEEHDHMSAMTAEASALMVRRFLQRVLKG